VFSASVIIVLVTTIIAPPPVRLVFPAVERRHAAVEETIGHRPDDVHGRQRRWSPSEPLDLTIHPVSNSRSHQFTVHRSPFTVHRSPFTVHRSPFTVHRSPFTVHRSPFLVFRHLSSDSEFCWLTAAS
jgi:hypothetical protein